MPILLLDRFLFSSAAAWVPVKGPNINDPVSDVFVATQSGDSSILVENGLNRPYAGALVSLTRPLYNLNGALLPYAAWHFRFRFVPETFPNLARWENDIKVCIKTRPDANTPIRNVANFSTQWNRDTGTFQIDHDPPGWVNSGYEPSAKVTTPDDWHTMDFRYSINEAAETFSIESLQWDDEYYVLPPEHRNIPLSLTNWEACTKFQLQTEGYRAGTVLEEYTQGVMAWSDAPIPAIIPTEETYA